MGNPRKFAIATYWNGFQVATTKYKDSCVVETEILNKGLKILLTCDPMPVLLIPTSSKHLKKDMEEEVMTTFLEPCIREFESLFINGFDVSYSLQFSIKGYFFKYKLYN